MSNKSLQSALKANVVPEMDDIELLDNDLDDVAGGACQGFTCGYYAPD